MGLERHNELGIRIQEQEYSLPSYFSDSSPGRTWTPSASSDTWPATSSYVYASEKCCISNLTDADRIPAARDKHDVFVCTLSG